MDRTEMIVPPTAIAGNNVIYCTRLPLSYGVLYVTHIFSGYSDVHRRPDLGVLAQVARICCVIPSSLGRCCMRSAMTHLVL